MSKEPVHQHPQLIGRQLALGFGAVSLVAVLMGALLLMTVLDVSGLVSGMRHQESSVTHSLELATSVREQSLHIARAVIEGDTSHLDEYEEWRARARSRIQMLGGAIPPSEHARLQVLGEKTQRIHDIFISTILPALKKGDLAQARATHREIETLSEQAAQDADALAQAVDARMHHSHRAATGTARSGLLVGGICAALVVALAAVFTLRLRAAVLKPLSQLTESATRFGRGEFDVRVGAIGEGEIASLAGALDRMAEEIALREKQLVRQERMAAIGQLAAGVAHELNNPIGIIRGYLKTMSPDQDHESLGEELRILDEEAAHCQRIAEDLLSYSRSSDLELQEVDMQGFLTESSQRFLEKKKSAAGEVVVEAEECRVCADPARVRQVFFNLLSNAAEVSEAATPIHVTGTVQGEVYRIDVQDTGPGVAPDDRQKLFEPFFSRRRGGTGLGLSVALGIVRAHGGTIDVVDTAKKGALFRVELPLSGPVSPAPEAESGAAA